MEGKIVVESFVTALACLCTSSFGPPLNQDDLKYHRNIDSLSEWDFNVLKILLNSNEIFTFETDSSECIIPNVDAVDLRLFKLEESIEKQRKLSEKLKKDLEYKIDFSYQPDVKYKEFEREMQELKKYLEILAEDCERNNTNDKAIIEKMLIENNELRLNCIDNKSSEANTMLIQSLIYNCTQEILKLSAEKTAIKDDSDKQIFNCNNINEELNKSNIAEIAKLSEEYNKLKNSTAQDISKKDELIVSYKNEIAKLRDENKSLKSKIEKEKKASETENNEKISKYIEENKALKISSDAEILKLQTENQARREEVLKLQKEIHKLHGGAIFKSCQNTEDSGLNNLPFCQELPVFCDHRVDSKYGTGWMLIAQRLKGFSHFYLNWIQYSRGFGKPSEKSDFFIGLEELHAITNSEPYELLFVLMDVKNLTRFAHYDDFLVGNEREQFVIKKLGNYTGDAGDSFTYHAGQKFTTVDRDNDGNQYENCAKMHTGAWWYKDCHKSNLFGLHKKSRSKTDSHKFNGMIWSTFHNTNDGNLSTMQIYLRPRKNGLSSNDNIY